MLFQPPPAEHALWDAWLFPHAGEYHLFYQQKRAGERQTIAWGMRSRPISSTGARSPRRMSGARRVLKVNIATDLGLGALAALGREERLTAAAMSALPAMAIMRAREAVARVVDDKIRHFLGSAGQPVAVAWPALTAGAR